MAKLPRLVFALALIVAAGSAVPASAGVRLGTVSIGAGYGYFSGPYWPGYWGGFYPGPFYGPWLAPWYGDPFYAPVYLLPQPDKGQVNLQTPDKNAEVYLDGAFAGTASDLKKFWLAPGVYQLEVRAAGVAPQEKRIYVLTGKTLKLRME
jgi:hypothetical protein